MSRAGTKLPEKVVARVAELNREGFGVNAIARRLKTEGLPGSAGAVSGLLAKAREAANAPPPRRRAKRPPPASSSPRASTSTSTRAKPAPTRTAPADPAPPAVAVADPDVAGAIGELAEVDAAHERLRKRLLLLGEKIDLEVAKPEPNWGLMRPLMSAEREVRDEVLRTRPVKARTPADDPANIEAARVVVASLRSRVDAHHALLAAAGR